MMRTGRMRIGTSASRAIALVAVAACAPVTHAQCQYSTVVIEGLPCPFGGQSPLIGQGLNNHGHVVGWWNHCSDAGTEAFFWSPETGRVTLPQPKTVFRAIAKDINDHGLIVGHHEFFSSTGLGWRGFVYNMKTGEYSYMPPHPDAVLPTLTDAIAINNDGIVAGRRSIGKSSTPYNAVIWDTNTGEVIDLGVQEGPNSDALDINEAGDFSVGWVGSNTPSTIAYIWSGRDVLSLGPVPGTDTSTAMSLDEMGTVGGFGFSFKTLNSLGFLWVNGVIAVIEPPDSFDSIGVRAMNNINQVLLGASIVSGSTWSYLLQYGVMVSVNAQTPGVGIASPSAINDAGQILARHNTPKAVLLTPIDQPLTDLDANCRTDVHDLIMLLNWWGECPPVKPGGVDLCRADLNGDGIVNVFDLLILLGNWD